MKNLLKILVPVLILVALAFSASAVDITNDTIVLAGNVSDALSTNFNVTNNGTDDITVSFSNINMSNSTYSFAINAPANTSNISIGNTVQSSLAFSIPANQYAGIYTGNLTAIANDSTNDSVAVIVTVNPFYNVSITSTQPNISQSLSGTMNINITNTGNIDLNDINYTITNFTSGANNLSFAEANSGTMDISYGESNITELTFNVPANQTAGTYTATLNVTYGNQQSQTAALTIVVIPMYDVSITPITALKFNFSNKGLYFTRTITIQNTGGLTLNSLVFNGAGIGSAYKFNLSDNDNATNNGTIIYLPSLASGNAWNITANGFIPENTRPENIGTVLFTSDNKNSSINFEMVASNMLRINRIRTSVDDATQTILVDGDSVTELADLDSDIEFKVEIENLYPDTVDRDISEITDITATLTIPEFAEDNDDFELEADTFDLKAESKDDATFTFNVPLRVADGNHDATFTIEGDDGTGVTHTDEWTITFRVDKKTHEIRIINAVPLELDCSREGTVDFSLLNIGMNSENGMIVTAQNSALGLNYKKEKIDLGSDPWDDDLQDISVPVDAGNASAGTYKVNVRVYLDSGDYLKNDYSAVQDINVVVKDCAPETITPTIPTTPVVISPSVPITPTTPTEPIVPVEQTPEIPFTETPEYVALLVLANITGLGIFGAIIAKFILLLRV